MPDSTAQVVIIGAGIMGASIAYHLAARGCTDVLILEQAETEISGSTARSAAGVRHQFSTEVNVRLSLYGVERLKHFTEEIGGNAELKQIGYLFLIDDPATWAEYQRSVAMQRRLGAHVELLTPEEAARFVPEMRTEGLAGATYGPDDGYCDPYGVASGYLKRARELGARLLRATPAIGIERDDQRVTAVATPRRPDQLRSGGQCRRLVGRRGRRAGRAEHPGAPIPPLRLYDRAVRAYPRPDPADDRRRQRLLHAQRAGQCAVRHVEPGRAAQPQSADRLGVARHSAGMRAGALPDPGARRAGRKAVLGRLV